MVRACVITSRRSRAPGSRTGWGRPSRALSPAPAGIGSRRRSGANSEPNDSPFWGFPTKNTLDLATAMFPKLMYERLDEMGLDFCVLYPSLGLVGAHFEDEEIRRASCPRAQSVLRRYMGRVPRPHHPGGDDPDAHAARGDRGTRIRGQRAGAQSGADGELRQASDPCRGAPKSRRRPLCVLA